ncbi:MAG: hypothetical protein ACI8W3_002568, partial [Myxococcota bacterium]
TRDVPRLYFAERADFAGFVAPGARHAKQVARLARDRVPRSRRSDDLLVETVPISAFITTT